MKDQWNIGERFRHQAEREDAATVAIREQVGEESRRQNPTVDRDARRESAQVRDNRAVPGRDEIRRPLDGGGALELPRPSIEELLSR
jgi:hypothetical protein